MGLGKGLDALMKSSVDLNDKDNNFTYVAIHTIKPNKNQARKAFADSEIEQLSESIKIHGVIQPLLLNRQKDGNYLLIAGERRYRAAKKAGIKELPAVIRDLNDEGVMEISLIENLQRVNLNPIEEAQGIKDLMTQGNLTQEQAADRVSKSRPAVANTLRLLHLPKAVQNLLLEEKLSRGHAKCLLGVADSEMQIYLATLCVEKNHSVRELEKLIKEKPMVESSGKKELDPELSDFENKLTEQLNTKVKISGTPEKGSIRIEYYSLDELEDLYRILCK